MKPRHGLTLIEVIVAIVLLGVSILELQLVAATMLHQTTESQLRMTAAQLAEDRIDLIKLEPLYANISNYASTENSIPSFPNYTRQTVVDVRRDSTKTGVTEYKRVSVTVRGPGLTVPIVRTLTIGAP